MRRILPLVFAGLFAAGCTKQTDLTSKKTSNQNTTTQISQKSDLLEELRREARLKLPHLLKIIDENGFKNIHSSEYTTKINKKPSGTIKWLHYDSGNKDDYFLMALVGDNFYVVDELCDVSVDRFNNISGPSLHFTKREAELFYLNAIVQHTNNLLTSQNPSKPL